MLASTDDMMYDLARYVLGDRLIVVEGRNGGATVPPDVKRSSNAYLAVISNWDANQRLDLSSILPVGILALRFKDCPAKMELSDFSSAEHLRVLDLSGCSLKKLPESIGQLKRLRYLNAPGIQERVLPVCLTRLDRLRYLSLRGSPLLSDLTEAL
jgi:Leucine-rich repeat (LRR) protein